MNPALIERLQAVYRQAENMGRGERSAYLKQQAAELGMSLATLYRKLEAVAVKPERKRRSDAGNTTLSLADAQRLSTHMMEGYRANDKSIQALKLSLEQLRAESPLFASAIDPETGETRQLSDSACARALRAYALHPEQLRATAPVQALASDHPNDVWQIDPSICTLFYVPGERQSGL